MQVYIGLNPTVLPLNHNFQNSTVRLWLFSYQLGGNFSFSYFLPKDYQSSWLRGRVEVASTQPELSTTVDTSLPHLFQIAVFLVAANSESSG